MCAPASIPGRSHPERPLLSELTQPMKHKCFNHTVCVRVCVFIPRRVSSGEAYAAKSYSAKNSYSGNVSYSGNQEGIGYSNPLPNGNLSWSGVGTDLPWAQRQLPNIVQQVCMYVCACLCVCL